MSRKFREWTFYNNSKATSVDATLKSLEAFERGVHLILGGKDKGAPYTPLLPLIKERVREVLLIGAAAPMIAQQLAGQVELVQAGDLATAVHEAFARSRPGDTVLLAPACSSFDQFTDYEERGRVFKELVKRLAGDVSAGLVARPKLEAFSAPGALPVETPASEPSPETDAVPSTEPAESPAVAVEIPAPPPPAPVDQRSPAEKRLAARKLAKELALAQAGRVVETPPRKIAPPERPAVPKVAELPPSPVPSVPEPIEAAADMPVILKTASPAPIPTAKPVTTEIPEPARTPDEPVINRPVSVSAGEPKAAIPIAPGDKGSAPPGPHRVELSYVYEVDAVDLPGMESQVVPEEEPTISISAGTAEVLDDEVMPFEARPPMEESGVRIPNSEVEAKSDVRSPNSEAEAGPEAGIPNSEVEAKSDVRSPNSEAEAGPEAGIPNSEVEAKSDVRSPNSEVEAKSDVRSPNSEAEAGSGVRSPNSEVEAASGVGSPNSDVEGPARPRSPKSEIKGKPAGRSPKSGVTKCRTQRSALFQAAEAV